jgi:hypothetical protein
MTRHARPAGAAPTAAAIALAGLVLVAAVSFRPIHQVAPVRTTTGPATTGQPASCAEPSVPDSGASVAAAGTDVAAALLPSAPPTDSADQADPGDVPTDGLGDAADAASPPTTDGC